MNCSRRGERRGRREKREKKRKGGRKEKGERGGKGKSRNEKISQSQKPSIKQAIVDFSLEGLTGQGDGFTRRGFQIGERVAAGRLYTPVNEIVAGEGFVESIEVSDSESGDGATSVPIAFNQLAVFDVSNITVTYVD